MKVQEIRTMARKLSLNPEKMKKTDLIRAIQSQEGNTPCFQTDNSGECGQMDCCWRSDCITVN